GFVQRTRLLPDGTRAGSLCRHCGCGSASASASADEADEPGSGSGVHLCSNSAGVCGAVLGSAARTSAAGGRLCFQAAQGTELSAIRRRTSRCVLPRTTPASQRCSEPNERYSGSVRSGRDSGFGIGRRLCFSFDGVKRAKDDSWGENFGQDFWRGTRIGWVEDIGGDSTASQSCEGVGDGWVFAGPVGTDQLDSAGVEALLHVGAIEHHALVDLTAQAPACSEVYEYRLALGAILRDELRSERLPLRVLRIDGGGRREGA